MRARAVAIAAILVVSARAAADDDADVAELAVPPFVPGEVALRAAVEAALPVGGGNAGDATSLALDAWYAVNSRFRVGLTTSHDARRELGAGRGLCLAVPGAGACDPRFGGLALDVQARLGDALLGRAALDTTRFDPTAVALELGIDLVHADGPWRFVVSPTLRLGVAHRELANGDAGALPAQIRRRLWPGGGVLGIVRAAVSLNALDDRPSLGAAAGAWIELGELTISARAGSEEIARTSAGHGVFGELALSWSR
jgi:hypothetical protein